MTRAIHEASSCTFEYPAIPIIHSDKRFNSNKLVLFIRDNPETSNTIPLFFIDKEDVEGLEWHPGKHQSST